MEKIINHFKPIFDQFPELISLPIFAWGRFYKYELRGHPFQRSAYEGFQDFKDLSLKKINGKEYQWKLYQKIDESLSTEEWNDIWDNIDDDDELREKCVKKYKFDEPGGKCLILHKSNNNITIQTVDCDTWE